MTRLESRMKDAMEGNEREVIETYNREIQAERDRKRHSKNGFIRLCCDQQIERLVAEKNKIDEAVFG